MLGKGKRIRKQVNYASENSGLDNGQDWSADSAYTKKDDNYLSNTKKKRLLTNYEKEGTPHNRNKLSTSPSLSKPVNKLRYYFFN